MKFQCALWRGVAALAGITVGLSCLALGADNQPPAGFTALFNGKDLTGWKIPEGDNGHWKAMDGVIDYDGQSEAEGNKSLWTEREFGDFTLLVDWRIKGTPFVNRNVRIILPDGSYKLNEHGEEIRIAVADSDSGILPRGHTKAQVNIWCWPIGSGEVYGYRRDESMPPEVRAGTTPLTHADNNIGEWNHYEITVRGERLTVHLNGKLVIDNVQLPGLPRRGPVGLQHHGAMRDGEWVAAPGLLQFKNLYIKELN